MVFECPLGDKIALIEVDDCPFQFGQTQRIAFQRQYNDSGARNSMTLANIKLKATWDTLADATDSTRVQYSPIIANPVFTPGDLVIEGENSNESPDGTGYVVGENPTAFTANLVQQASWVIKTIKDYGGETLQVYLYNESDQIGCEADDAQNPTVCYGLRIRRLYVKSRNIPGLGATDKNELSMTMPARWDDNFLAVTPTGFSPVHDLLNDPTP